MNNRTSVALLIGAVAVALPTSIESFAPTTSLRLRTSPPSCRCSTEAALFPFRRRNRNKTEIDEPSSPPEQNEQEEQPIQSRNSRRSFLSATAASATLFPLRSFASSDKQINISDDDLKQIILSDIVDKSFLVSADITRSVYDESASFTDEIDVYTMDKWVKGTQALFIPSGSRVSLVGDVDVSSTEVSFRFDEDLMFNIPFKPVCSLTGKVVLKRDAQTGLITSYQEFWDQNVNDVLKTAKFGKKA